MRGQELTSNILENIANIEWLRSIIPTLVKNGVLVCIASFLDEDEEALYAGKDLIRLYLDALFPGGSEELGPGRLPGQS